MGIKDVDGTKLYREADMFSRHEAAMCSRVGARRAIDYALCRRAVWQGGGGE